MSKGKRKKWTSITFICQSQIEDRKKCIKQCEHCKQYYTHKNENTNIKTSKPIYNQAN